METGSTAILPYLCLACRRSYSRVPAQWCFQTRTHAHAHVHPASLSSLSLCLFLLVSLTRHWEHVPFIELYSANQSRNMPSLAIWLNIPVQAAAKRCVHPRL